MSTLRIPWAQPFLGEEEVGAVAELLRRRRLSMGAEVRAFEQEAAALVGRSAAVAVANGTVALDVALDLVGVKAHDEVVVSALSYIATTNAVVRRRATPVFCDVDPRTLNIDPVEVRLRITPRTKALLVSDYCGAPVDYDALLAIAEDAGVPLVLDGAQSLGARHRGRPTCSLGTVSTTSFHTAKIMACGEGGMVFADDPRQLELARRLRGQGEVPGRKYIHDTLASNHRLTEPAAAIGRVQLRRAQALHEHRRRLAARYTERLREVSRVSPTHSIEHAEHAWFSYAVLLPERDSVARRLADRGVETRSLYPLPAYRQPIPEYAPYAREVRPVAESATRRVLNLPMFFEMALEQVDEVVDALAASLDEALDEAPAAPAAPVA